MRNTHVCVKNPFKIVMCNCNVIDYESTEKKKLNIWKEERKKEKRK